MSKEILKNEEIRAVLAVNKEEVALGRDLRKKSLDDAVALSKGPSREEKDLHPLWEEGKYQVGVGKPGKETGRVIPNINDMWPYIKEDGVLRDKSATFDDISYELEKLNSHSPYALELLGCLFIRSALMLDHEIVGDKVIYNPPKIVVEKIMSDISTMFDVPLEVFLQYLEAIALNEDVKYQCRLNQKGKPYGKTAGRPNNLLSAAHLIAVLLGRTSIVGFATGFSKFRGVSPIPADKIISCFPDLSGNFDWSKNPHTKERVAKAK